MKKNVLIHDIHWIFVHLTEFANGAVVVPYVSIVVIMIWWDTYFLFRLLLFLRLPFNQTCPTTCDMIVANNKVFRKRFKEGTVSLVHRHMVAKTTTQIWCEAIDCMLTAILLDCRNTFPSPCVINKRLYVFVQCTSCSITFCMSLCCLPLLFSIKLFSDGFSHGSHWSTRVL